MPNYAFTPFFSLFGPTVLPSAAALLQVPRSPCPASGTSKARAYSTRKLCRQNLVGGRGRMQVIPEQVLVGIAARRQPDQARIGDVGEAERAGFETTRCMKPKVSKYVTPCGRFACSAWSNAKLNAVADASP